MIMYIENLLKSHNKKPVEVVSEFIKGTIQESIYKTLLYFYILATNNWIMQPRK